MQEALIKAIVRRNTPQVHALLQQGADPNGIVDSSLLTPLHFAAQLGALKITQLLVTAGAKLLPASEEDNSQTALDTAKLHHRTKVVALLRNTFLTQSERLH